MTALEHESLWLHLIMNWAQKDINIEKYHLNMFKKIDVYSFNLIIWEMMTKTKFEFQYEKGPARINQGRPYEFYPKP